MLWTESQKVWEEKEYFSYSSLWNQYFSDIDIGSIWYGKHRWNNNTSNCIGGGQRVPDIHQFQTMDKSIPSNKKEMIWSSSASTTDINTTTYLTAVFVVDNATTDDIVKEHTVFGDNLENEKEIKSQVGYCTKFPRDVLII